MVTADHVTSRWDGIPLTSQSALLEAEDGATIITETMKEDETRESKNCSERTGKVPLSTTYSMKKLIVKT
ncbi:hypothetical protein WUBG_01947 [Wuchereria bancrofti]|uniref:Uncharacterized protein n=1 Tax=Wuchereria bancrofti TaxID=6293 RepID=J9EX12_WUCBA|nr:hypothetical protein WUBG_01947 [Wuchereria bancrofti]